MSLLRSATDFEVLFAEACCTGNPEGGISSYLDVEDAVDSSEAFPCMHMVALDYCSGADTTDCVFGTWQKYTDVRLHRSTSIFPIGASGSQNPDDVPRDGDQSCWTISI